MMRFVLPCLVLGLVFFATGCGGGDSIDAVAKEYVKAGKEGAEAAMKGDKEGAEKAAKKLKELEEKIKKLKDKKSDEEWTKEWAAALKKAAE